MREQAPLETEYLSTMNEMNPVRALEAFGADPVILCVVAIWTRHTFSGNLEEKGAWIHGFWKSALEALPEIAGCRLSWNSLFFVAANRTMDEAVQQFRDLLTARQDGCLESFSVLCEAAGDPRHKLDVLDVLGHEVGSDRDFGSSREFRPDGYKFYHLRDGKPYSMK